MSWNPFASAAPTGVPLADAASTVLLEARKTVGILVSWPMSLADETAFIASRTWSLRSLNAFNTISAWLPSSVFVSPSGGPPTPLQASELTPTTASILRAFSPAASHAQDPEGEISLRWIVVQILILFSIFRMAIPFYSSRTPARMLARWKWRTAVDVWLVLSMILHAPGIAAVGSPAHATSTRLFMNVFVVFLVSTQLVLAVFVVAHHAVGWVLRVVSPRMVDVLGLPSGIRYTYPITAWTVVRLSFLVSTLISLVFVGCSIESKNADGPPPMVCHFNHRNPNMTSVSEISKLVYGFDAGKISILDSPLGTLWLGALAILAVWSTTRRSIMLSRSARIKAIGDITDPALRIDALRDLARAGEIIDQQILAYEESTGQRLELDAALENVVQTTKSGYVRSATQDSKLLPPRPKFQPMAEWYALAAADAGWQLLLHLKLFVGRFDIRVLQRPGRKSTAAQDELYGSASTADRGSTLSGKVRFGEKFTRVDTRASGSRLVDEEGNAWFDWFADTGDGGNSTYDVARWLARPSLFIRRSVLAEFGEAGKLKSTSSPSGDLVLPRPNLVIVGGDLVYPSASLEEYERRLVLPFSQALEAPPSYRTFQISTNATGSMGDVDDFPTMPTPSLDRSALRGSTGRGARKSRDLFKPKRENLLEVEEEGEEEGYHEVDDEVSLEESASAKVSPLMQVLKRPVTDVLGSSSASLSSVFQNPATSASSNNLPSFKATAPAPAPGGGGGGSGFASPTNAVNFPSMQAAFEDRLHSSPPRSTPPPKPTMSLQMRGPPLMYAIPGNHDYLDGLYAFTRCFIDRDWLGGWRLPQHTTYFALKLPHGWWLFCVDQGLSEDIDSRQYRYFARVVRDRIEGTTDRVVLCAHEPGWLYDAYAEAIDSHRSPNLRELIKSHIKDRLALRICGDLHNYIRYDSKPVNPLHSSTAPSPRTSPGIASQKYNSESSTTSNTTKSTFAGGPTLVVSGGGGAFLHPTHHFPETLKCEGFKYERTGAYPNVAMSERIGLSNLGSGFRIMNWSGFDIVGSFLYFLLVSSLFPRCGTLNRVIYEDSSMNEVPMVMQRMLEECLACVLGIIEFGNVSLVLLCSVFMVTFGFADGEKGPSMKLRLAVVHGFAHIIVAIFLFLLVQMTVELAIQDGLAGQSYYSLFDSWSSTEAESSVFLRIFRELLRLFDLPEFVAVPHARVCAPNSTVTLATSTTRFEFVSYYLVSYIGYKLLAADAVSMVLGAYLAASSVLKVHWNECFASLRNEHFKSFVRFKIDHETGDLHAFVMGIDRVPRSWQRNPRYETNTGRLVRWSASLAAKQAAGIPAEPPVVSELDPRFASFGSDSPSMWIPELSRDSAPPRLVDYFVVRKETPTLHKTGSFRSESSSGDMPKFTPQSKPRRPVSLVSLPSMTT